MRVADAVSRLRLLAADITLLCHDCCSILSELLTEAPILPDYGLSDNSPLIAVVSEICE
jgi:hypothetical protein